MTRMDQKLAIYRNFASLSLAALLAGCGTAPPATQTVYVPVHTPCVKGVPPAPEYEFDKLPLHVPDGVKILALARDWPRGRKYESALSAAMAACVERK